MSEFDKLGWILQQHKSLLERANKFDGFVALNAEREMYLLSAKARVEALQCRSKAESFLREYNRLTGVSNGSDLNEFEGENRLF